MINGIFGTAFVLSIGSAAKNIRRMKHLTNHRKETDMATGTLSRIADIIRADVDDLLNRMEDPEKMSRLMMTEMENAVNNATAAVADAMAGQRLLERRLKARRADAAAWDRTAERAVSQGNDDLARLTLERKTEVDTEAKSLRRPWRRPGG